MPRQSAQRSELDVSGDSGVPRDHYKPFIPCLCCQPVDWSVGVCYRSDGLTEVFSRLHMSNFFARIRR